MQVTEALVDHGALTPTDGIPDTRRRSGDQLSRQLSGHPYTLGTAAVPVLTSLGVPTNRLTVSTHSSRRPLLRFCLDWSEQRHHLAGGLGTDLLAAFTAADWITRAPHHRAVQLTPTGRQAFNTHLGLNL